MLASRFLSRVSRSAGLRSSLSAATAAALPPRNQSPIFSNRYHSLVHNFSQKLVAAQVSLDSFSLQRFSLSSSTESHEKESSNTESAASKTSEEEKATTSEANESESKARRKGAKRATAVSESDSGSDDDEEEEMSKDDLMKLVAEKEELLYGKEEELKQMKDKVLRTYAEMENVMDRTRRDAENTKKYAIQNFAKSLLDVADNLGRASSVVKESFSKLDNNDTSKEEDSAGGAAAPLLKTLLEGVEMTEKQLAEVFKKFGMEKYDPINEPFDPNRHNAMFQVPDASKPEGTVAHVLKSGYTLYDRVIRPAEVGVTQGGESEENKKESGA
ncbi:grpE protein homolog 2, mitochondrial isoform X2 [Raphanus sativus]|uniref:GrpE protein homolog n=1 Tax=Raphanus sativus TaxID=3726 RepID=A0A6J0KMV0_RAPSA|nr:grpE protein homolog 2, mitochondrial isoform X2 [Raphanus sativus]